MTTGWRRDDRMSHLMRRCFAAALIVCFVAMTSWASACDLACSLPQFHSVCKLDGPAASEMPSMDMSTMDMSQHSMPDAESLGSVHLHANSCTQSPCNEASISAVSKSASQHPVHTLPIIAFEHPTSSVSEMQVSWNTPESEPPDLQPFDPLAVSLRI